MRKLRGFMPVMVLAALIGRIGVADAKKPTPTTTPASQPAATNPASAPATGRDDDKAGLMFLGNFENGFDGWNTSLASSQPWSSSIVTSPGGHRGHAARIELRRTDPIVAASHRSQFQVSGAGNGSIAVPKGLTPALTAGREIWIGFSVYVPPDWKIERHYAPECVFEVKDAKPRSPPLAIEINGARWSVHRNSGHGPQNDPSWVATYAYTPMTVGAWADFVFHVKWSTGSDGLVEVWKDGVQFVNMAGPNNYSDATRYLYPLWGVYKYSWSDGYKTDPAITTRVLYFDSVRMTDETGNYGRVAPTPRSGR